MSKNLIRFDWALKRLLRNKANFKVLEGFLSELLNQDITIITILESESNQISFDDKFNRVDLLVENAEKELTIIEIQQRNEFDYFHRILYGTSKIISEYLHVGEPYSSVKKVYSVNILYFDLGHGDDYVYHGKTDFTGIHKHDRLGLSQEQIDRFHKFKPEQIFPEYYIIKVNNFNDYATNTLDEWIYYFKNDIIKDEFKAKGLEEAKKILKVDKLTEDERISYKKYWENKSYEASMLDTIKFEVELAYKKEREAEIEQERKRHHNEKISKAKDGIAKNYPIDIIADLTGLSKEEIIKLQNEQPPH